jgi:chromatin segregation and condensation protein Rec8/ScpA/Scc1 (kleisin family)
MDKVLELIIKGSDWESVLKEIVVEEGLDLWNIDISALADALVKYISELSVVNFRIPARFILISAILLRLKSESLTEKEVEERVPETLDLEGLESLEMPLKRIPVRNISFEELTLALKKVVRGTQIKEERKIIREQKIRNIQNIVEMDVDDYIGRIYDEIKKIRATTFFSLTSGKEDLESAKYFVAMLHLANQQKVSIRQELYFKDIDITLKELAEINNIIDAENNENIGFSERLEEGIKNGRYVLNNVTLPADETDDDDLEEPPPPAG